MTRHATGTIRYVTGMLGALVLILGGNALAQQARSLNVGSFYFNTSDAMNADEISFPRNQLSSDLDMLDVFGVVIGTRRTWTDKTGVVRDIQVAQIAYRKFSDLQEVTPPVAGKFKRVYRNPYPSKVLDGKDRTDILAKGDPVDPNLPSDVAVYSHLRSWTGIDIERWAYGFANEDYDDFAILEYKFTNTSGEKREDVYLGIQAETSSGSYYPADLWANYYGATYAKYAAGDPTADSLRFFYSWEGDQIAAQPTIDTRGEPDAQWGNFREPQYMGVAVLHADTGPNDETDNPAQPWKAGWSQRELAPDLNVAGHEDIYNYLCNSDLTTQLCQGAGWDPNNPGNYAVTVDADGNLVPDKTGPYRILDPTLDNPRDPNVSIDNSTAFDPLTEQEKTVLLSFGPYQMEPGDDVRIVIALVGGQIPHRWAIDAGRAYPNGNASQRDMRPLPYNVPGSGAMLRPDEKAVVDAWTGGANVATQGSMLDRRTKNSVLELGRVIAFLNAGKANRVWKGGNVNALSGSFNLPMAPATPSLQGISENDQVRLKWGNEAASDTRAGTIDKYRIYREYTRPAAVVIPTDTTFLFHDEVPASAREYVDTRVVRGENYYYYVAPVTIDGIEGSEFLNRTGTTDNKILEALTPSRGPDAGWKDNVVVVPNPFHSQGADNYSEAKRLVFLNLPAYCNIHIFTVTGDRVQTLEHASGTGDSDWPRQETFSTMEIVSGIYIYVVEELDGPRGKPTGETSIGKFVVIK